MLTPAPLHALTLGLQLAPWAVGLFVVGFVLVSLVLMLTILIQKPQGGGLSGAFGAGAGSGQTAFGTKTGDALTIATISMFAVWVIFGVGLNYALTPQTQAPVNPALVAPAGGAPAPASGGQPAPAGNTPAPADSAAPSNPPAGAPAPEVPAQTPPAPSPAPAGETPATNPPAEQPKEPPPAPSGTPSGQP